MANLDFPTKEFNLLVPFTKVDMPPSMKPMMGEDEETLTIEGFANWFGEDVDENGDGVACDLAGDAVVPTGIDLSVYKGNPQILWQHDRCASIGKANKAVRKKQGLFVNAIIYKSAMEEQDWFRIKNGLVTRFSIGFRTLAGEYKKVGDREVFFITKSLLLEISVVTIPCSSESGFSIIKRLEDGAFTSSLHKEIEEPHPNPAEEEIPKTNKEDDNTMRLPLKDLLSEAEVEHFKSLGLEAELETEKEVSAKAYIDNAIAKAAEAIKTELRAEFAKSSESEEETTEVETEAKEESEEVETEATEEEVETEVETKSETDDTQETVEVTSLKAALDELKTLFAEEK